MPEMDEISARLSVIETVLRQLITHMAVRADDPPEWVRTRRVLAIRALDGAGNRPLRQAALIRDAVAQVFDQAEHVAQEYAHGYAHRELQVAEPVGTRRALAR
jgi:hypothetical protein